MTDYHYADWDAINETLRKEHNGTGSMFDGRWSCLCGKQGGGTGPNAGNWHRGHDMHLRAVARRLFIAQIAAERRTPPGQCPG